MLSRAFAKGCGGKIINPLFKVKHLKTMSGVNVDNAFPELDTIASFGVLRGCDLAMKKSKEFWYIDHGYFGGYYRITRNETIHDGKGNHDWDRFNKFDLNQEDWKMNGTDIVLCPPSVPQIEFLNINNWVEDTVSKIKRYTDKRIIISQKVNSPKGFYPSYKENFINLPIDEALKNAWVLITDHSNTMVTALLRGIPVICTNKNRRIGSLDKIESPEYNREWLRNLAYNQWSLKEIKSGKAWEELNMWG